ncbi:MAG: hypothetical protein ACJAV6_000051 [Candidatus Paceibacteria bacterium]|jgi:hypothetical protein
MKKYTNTEIKEFLKKMNHTYARLHKAHENYFWKSYMGQPEYNSKMNSALAKRIAFQANPKNLEQVENMLQQASTNVQTKLELWKHFFHLHQAPASVQEIQSKIADLENKIAKKKNFEKEGYIIPNTKKFKKMSRPQMRTAMTVEPDEKLRKAYFKGLESTAASVVPEYLKLVSLRNEYAQALGYSDFYTYKSEHEDNLTKDELFGIFDTIYEKTKYAFEDIRTLEKEKKGLRKPWNFSYLMSGDFIKREDEYFQLGNALPYWGQAFHNMGIHMDGGTIQLDLVARTGKYNNGFCHWPDLVQYEGTKKIPGSANFTCNAVPGQVGSGSIAMNTLFHEGGHAAHLLNSTQTETCVNTEFLPMTSAWAETHSMILDSIFSSIEWRTRYATNDQGEHYPFELFEEKIKKMSPIIPTRMMSINAVMSFERDVYEAKNLTEAKVIAFAKKNFKKYFDQSEDSLWLLAVPHIYSFDSSCSYHGYGLAEITLTQWKEYFYKKYGYMVDNKNIGKEMKKVWTLAASKTFPEFVTLATGKKLSPQAFIKKVTRSEKQILKTAKKRIAKMETIKKPKALINLKSNITMVHGTKKICDNKKSFKDMSEKYAKWIKKQSA